MVEICFENPAVAAAVAAAAVLGLLLWFLFCYCLHWDWYCDFCDDAWDLYFWVLVCHSVVVVNCCDFFWRVENCFENSVAAAAAAAAAVFYAVLVEICYEKKYLYLHEEEHELD